MNLKKTYNALPSYGKVIVIVVIIVIVFYIIREVKRFMDAPRKVKVNWKNIPVVGGDSEEQVLWDPDPLAREISENFEGYNFITYPETADKIIDLQTDDQVKLLYNHYNKKYAKDYPTLTQLLDNEWSDWGGSYKAAVSRLKALGLR